jgi:hypothetical protein
MRVFVMNARRAEFAISGVKYDVDHRRVYKLRVHRIRAGEAGAPMDVSRGQLVSAVGYGTTFLVARVNDDGRVRPHAPLRVVQVDGVPYLRCDEERVPSDDFPDLPRL